MGRTFFTEPRCLYKGALYLYLILKTLPILVLNMEYRMHLIALCSCLTLLVWLSFNKKGEPIHSGLSLMYWHSAIRKRCIETYRAKISMYTPREALRTPGDWGFQDFSTMGIWMWQGYQPYATAVFTPNEVHLVFISVGGWVDLCYVTVLFYNLTSFL